jgi:hypothetical protein
VASEIAKAINEELFYIPDLIREERSEFTLHEGERIGFCFPTHGWQPPRIVRRFIRQLHIEQAEGHYNLNNVFSNHTANLSGGSSADGTAVLSYTNDGKNATSNNRQWVITLVDRLPEEEPHPDAIQGPRADYALAYDQQGQRLHFGGDEPSQLTFPVTLYNQAGAAVLRFRACDGANLRSLPRGIYIVSWKLDGRQRAVKFSK